MTNQIADKRPRDVIETEIQDCWTVENFRRDVNCTNMYTAWRKKKHFKWEANIHLENFVFLISDAFV